MQHKGEKRGRGRKETGRERSRGGGREEQPNRATKDPAKRQQPKTTPKNQKPTQNPKNQTKPRKTTGKRKGKGRGKKEGREAKSNTSLAQRLKEGMPLHEMGQVLPLYPRAKRQQAQWQERASTHKVGKGPSNSGAAQSFKCRPTAAAGTTQGAALHKAQQSGRREWALEGTPDGLLVAPSAQKRAPWGKTCSELAECREKREGKGETEHEAKPNQHTKPKPQPTTNTSNPKGAGVSPALC